jgi:F0F1-type ATP synthase assembly protein I
MIKNFLDADEDDSLITKRSADEKPADVNDFDEFAAPFARIEDEADLLELSELKAGSPDVLESQKVADDSVVPQTPLEMLNEEIAEQTTGFPAFEAEKEAVNHESPAAEKKEVKNEGYEIFSQSPYQSESSDETIRKSGLAYSAAIILFGSIVFTLILGWFADLLLGTSPWGKVGGIILGSIIGFIQFFRTTSQLFKNKD